MKVLVVNTVDFLTNGISSVILNYFRNIDKSDLQMDFVVTGEIEDSYRSELCGNSSELYFIKRNGNPLKYMCKLFKVLKSGKYDVIHVHGNSATMFFDLFPAFLAGTSVRIAHSHNTTCSHLKMHKLLKPFFNLCYTHGFACGEDAGKWLFGKKDFVVLKNGIELEKYAFDQDIREEYRQKLGAGSKSVMGHVGNIITQKNHTFLLDAFAKLHQKDENCLLALFGEGELRQEMENKAKDLGIENDVLFMGKSSEINCFMQAMDMFLLPSLHEGLPVVLVEAQASGLPCIVSDKVALEANLAEEMTYLPIEDPQVWVEEILKAEISADRKETCKKWQQKIAEKGYDIKQNADQMKNLYLSYLEK